MSANYTPDKEDLKILSPFKMQVLTNFPYIEADFDALTNYQLLCKVVEYLNNVIAETNEVTEQTLSLYNAYVALQDYVNQEIGDFETTVNNRVDGLETYMDNYFNNLDVQQEINNKLDAMALDGSLTALISAYVDPIYQAYENSINSEVSNFKSSVNSKLALQDAEIAAVTSGSPLVASSTSGMTNTSRVYVNTTDGNWYYYDGDSWEIGGTYQSTGIGLNSVAPENLSNDLKNILDISIPTITVAATGKYVNKRGVIDTTLATSFCYTDPIQLKKNCTIKYNAKGFSTDVSLISTCDENGDNIKAQVISTDSDYKEYTYTATEDTYVILSYDNSTPAANFVISNNIDNINDRLEKVEDEFNITIPEYTLTSGYIDNNGHIQTASNFKISSPIYVTAGSTIYLYARGYLQVISMITETTEDGTIISPLVVSTDSNYNVYTYNVTENKYIEICYLSDNENDLRDFYIKYEFNNISSILNSITSTPKAKSNILTMFSNITCIGDSLTYSQVYTGASTSRQAYQTYPEVIEKLTGTSVSNISNSGASASSWWTSYNSQIVEKENQLTIIYLGTNEGLTDTMNTDVIGNDYTQYASTNTGCYAKIIKKSLDLHSKVILIKCYNEDTFSTTNDVIDQMGTRFNVPVLENERYTEDLYHYYPNQTGTNYIHYNDLGYQKFAYDTMTKIDNFSTSELLEIIPE